MSTTAKGSTTDVAAVSATLETMNPIAASQATACTRARAATVRVASTTTASSTLAATAPSRRNRVTASQSSGSAIITAVAPWNAALNPRVLRAARRGGAGGAAADTKPTG